MKTKLTISLDELSDEALLLILRATNTEVNLLQRLYGDYPDPGINATFTEQRKTLRDAELLIQNVLWERRMIKMGVK